MKNLKNLFIISLVIFAFTACEENIDPNDNEINVPEKFTVEIPSSISNETVAKSARTDELDGNDIYEHMRLFIHVGEESAELVEDIMKALRVHNINQEMTITYTSEDDQREKTLIVEENKTFEGKEYDMFLTVKDQDGTVGMQVIWNTNPVEGSAIISPYNINRLEDDKFMDVMYRVDYSEVELNGYSEHMTVSISGWPMPISDVYGLDNLKMFVGKKDENIELFGNSNHPNAVFLNPENVGYNWVFVARASLTEEKAVANVALPRSTVNTNIGLFENFGIRSVLIDEMVWWASQLYPNLSEESLLALIEANYLQEAKAPAYFNAQGYISSGDNIPEGWSTDFINLDGFVPYIPSEIAALQLSFIE